MFLLVGDGLCSIPLKFNHGSDIVCTLYLMLSIKLSPRCKEVIDAAS